MELITVYGNHAHRAHDLTALRLGGPAENIIQAVVPIGVSLHWLGSCGGPGLLLILNGLYMFEHAFTVLLLLVVLGARFLLFGGSRRCLASLHDILNNLRFRDENIARLQGGIRPSNGLFGGHAKLVALVTAIVLRSVIVAL